MQTSGASEGRDQRSAGYCGNVEMPCDDAGDRSQGVARTLPSEGVGAAIHGRRSVRVESTHRGAWVRLYAKLSAFGRDGSGAVRTTQRASGSNLEDGVKMRYRYEHDRGGGRQDERPASTEAGKWRLHVVLGGGTGAWPDCFRLHHGAELGSDGGLPPPTTVPLWRPLKARSSRLS